MLEKEFEYFESNKESLRARYAGKEVVIAHGKVVGAYDDPGAAYRMAKESLQPGTFIIQTVYENPEDEEECILPFVYE